jgi:NitT/TauT family transport system substrate-binding protein
MRVSRATGITGLLVVFLFANPALTAAQEQKLVPLKMGILKIAGYTNVYAAQKQNMFRDNGLDLTTVFFRATSDAITAVHSGSVDIFCGLPGSAMSANERGFDFGAIFQNEVVAEKGPDTGAILVLKDSGIRSVKDLVGKKVATPVRSSQVTVAFDEVLRQHGIDPRQVNYVEAPYPSHYDMLRTKQVDAVTATEPFTTRIMLSGLVNVVSWHYAEGFGGGPVSVAFAKRSYIAQNRDVIDRFNKSMQASIDYMLADKERGKRLVVEFTGLESEIVEKMVYPLFNYDVRPGRWQQVIKIMTDSKILEKPHTPEEYFSDPIKRFIKK